MTEAEKARIAEWREETRQREEAYRRTLAEVVKRLKVIEGHTQMMNFGAAKIGVQELEMVLSDDFGPSMLFEDKLKEVSK